MAFAFPANAEVNVVASIKPIHSLVSAVMHGAGEPSLVVKGAGTPHQYSLKPSMARELEQADVIFWIGLELETFLDKPVGTVGWAARSVPLGNLENLLRLEQRESGNFSQQDGRGHEKADGHDHAPGIDPHLWLDPRNAIVMVGAIADTLAEIDPANAALYKTNANTVRLRIEALAEDLESELRPVSDRPFIVFHDAYQYFERRFGLRASGSIAVGPELGTGVRRMRQVRQVAKDLGAGCIFAEPQFDPGLVAVATEDTTMRTAMLDPLGSGLKPGPEHYFDLLQDMAQAFRDCLGGD